jgi:uncharacterized membrane protein
MTFLKLCIIALPIYVLLDLIWLGLVAKNFYQGQIGSLFKTEMNWYAILAFYVIFVASLVVFVITPAIEKASWMHALVYGAFFGLACYATYDLINYALLKDWPLAVTLVDLVWGTAVVATVSTVTYVVARFL